MSFFKFGTFEFFISLIRGLNISIFVTTITHNITNICRFYSIVSRSVASRRSPKMVAPMVICKSKKPADHKWAVLGVALPGVPQYITARPSPLR